MENSSQASRIIAALKYFGLVEYEGSGNARKIIITEDAKNYLRANQENIKKEILARLALMPKEIAKFWEKWGIEDHTMQYAKIN